MSDSTNPDRIGVTCPKCGKVSHTAASNIGLSAHCKCGESFVVSESHIAACPCCGELTPLDAERCPMCDYALRGSKPKRPGQPTASASPKMADDSSPFRHEKFVKRGLKKAKEEPPSKDAVDEALLRRPAGRSISTLKRKPILIIVFGVLAIVGFLAWDRWEIEVVKYRFAEELKKQKEKDNEEFWRRTKVTIDRMERKKELDKFLMEQQEETDAFLAKCAELNTLIELYDDLTDEQRRRKSQLEREIAEQSARNEEVLRKLQRKNKRKP